MAAISAELKLQIDKFRAGLKEAQSKLSAFKSSVTNAGRNLGGALLSGIGNAISTVTNAIKVGLIAAIATATAATIGLAAGLKQAFDLGGALSDLSSQTGIAARDLKILEQAFIDNGIAGSQVRMTVNKLQRSIIEAGYGLQTYTRAFDALGISVDEVREKSPLEQFQMIVSALRDVESFTERNAIAMQLLGRSGGQLMTLVDDVNAFEKATATLGSQIDLLADNANLFDRIADLIGSLFRTKTQGFFIGAAEKVGPVLLPILERLDKLDFAPQGQIVGEMVAKFVRGAHEAMTLVEAAFEQLDTTQLTEMLKTGLSLAFKTAANVLHTGLVGAASAAGSVLQTGIQGALQMLAVLSQSKFWDGMKDAMRGIHNSIQADFLDLVAGDVPNGHFNILKQTANEIREDLAADAAYKAEGASNLMEQAASGAIAKFKDAIANSKPLFDTEGDQAIWQGFLDQLAERRKELETEFNMRFGGDGNTRKARATFDGTGPSEEAGFELGMGNFTEALVGRFQAATNLLFGRSANELIAVEARRQTAILETQNTILQKIESNTRSQPSRDGRSPNIGAPPPAGIPQALFG